MYEKELKEIMEEMESGNEVYWCLYLTKESIITVVCLQWFDEYDYDQDRFVKQPGKDYRLCFDTEENAIQWLNDHVVEEKIEPKYRRITTKFFKDSIYDVNKREE